MDRLLRSLSRDSTFIEHPASVLCCLIRVWTGLLRSVAVSVLLVPLSTTYLLATTPSPLTA
uniref:Uncharacterized protein n=1 Tax=Phlebia radiata TaxID=5308 RepID=L8B9B5_PHLRA|nr:hypothetical protein PRA_mt0171 [Phlebia radiata]CCE89238.1 hypothetical protein PRA_mt0171 [Phlebia radiata]